MNQTLTHALLTRTAEVEKRLMVMAQEHDSGQKPTPHLVKSALRDLGETLEELRVATEQLQLAADDIAVARREATVNADRYRELYEGLPMACLMTNDEGCVTDANPFASRLLNVSAPYLTGKPLMLYLPQREAYFDLLERVKNEGHATARAVLRPRDRKPMDVKLTVAALKHQSRWCWVFGPLDGSTESRTPVDGALLTDDPGLH
jgi:PAS domain-containing protein